RAADEESSAGDAGAQLELRNTTPAAGVDGKPANKVRRLHAKTHGRKGTPRATGIRGWPPAGPHLLPPGRPSYPEQPDAAAKSDRAHYRLRPWHRPGDCAALRARRRR